MSLYGPLAKLEEDRRRRRLEELDRKFKMTIQHIEAVERVNEAAYKAKKAVIEQASKHSAPQRPVVMPPRAVVKIKPAKKKKK